MKYEELQPINLSEAEAILSSGTAYEVVEALLRASMSDVDPTWVEAACLRCLEQSDRDIQGAALTALGHLARRTGHINVNAVLEAVKPLREDPALSGKVDDMMDDITMFVTSPQAKRRKKVSKARGDQN